LSLDSIALLDAVRKSQAAGASDRDLAWGRDTVWRAERIWTERHNGIRVEDSIPRREPIAWPSTTPTYNPALSAYGNEVAPLKIYQQQLAAHWANRRLG
jgi:hypothetical protein